MKYTLPAILLLPLALNAMELELGNEQSYRELSVAIRLCAPDIQMQDINFNGNITQVRANVTHHQDAWTLSRFYAQSGARLHTNLTDKITLHADTYTADVNLISATSLPNNDNNVVVNYTISKPLYCFFASVLSSKTVTIPIGAEDGYHETIFNDEDAVLIHIQPTWQEYQITQ